MSSLKNLRSRFPGAIRDKQLKEPTSLTEGPVEVDRCKESRFDTMTDMCQGLSDSLSVSSFKDETEKQVFEQQLNSLQEQLVASMIENQSLAQKLKSYEDENPEELKVELMKKSQRCVVLAAELKKYQKREEKRKNKNKKKKDKAEDSGSDNDNEMSADDILSLHSLADDNEEQVNSVPLPPITPLPPEGRVDGMRTRLERLGDRLIGALYEVFDDFTEEPAAVTNVSEESLNVKRLKANIKRFQCAFKPYMSTVKGLYNLITWKSPAYTLLVFLMYMYLVYTGWFIPFLFFLFAFKLSVNYLQHRNIIKRGVSFLDAGDDQDVEDKELGLSDKFNLVLHVATKVQNTLGTLADNLEKLKNLFIWRYPPATKKLMMMCVFTSIGTIFFSATTVLTLLGLGLGVKIFCVNIMYNKYPRLKRKHDSTHRLWLALPTDAEYEHRVVRAEMNKYIVIPANGEEISTFTAPGLDIDDSDESGDDSFDHRDFRELFSLPPTESPLQGWMRGKRTVLIGKDRGIVSLLSKKRGKLYLTKSFLCFEREKVPSPRNILIPLSDIIRIEKVKPYSRMPGRGMAIQISIRHEGKENMFVFGGIIGRDEVVQAIEEAMRIVPVVPGGGRSDRDLHRSPTPSRRSIELSQNQNVTFAVDYIDSD